MAVWKVELAILGDQSFQMPKGSEIIEVREQAEMGCMWFRFDDAQKGNLEARTFSTRGTRWDFDGTEGNYVGSYHLSGGALVFHVFEKKVAHEKSN